MRLIIGIDIHRTFGEVVIWGEGRLRHEGRCIDMTRTALEGFGTSLQVMDEVVIEATGNCIAVSRVVSPFVKRVVIAWPYHSLTDLDRPIMRVETRREVETRPGVAAASLPATTSRRSRIS